MLTFFKVKKIVSKYFSSSPKSRDSYNVEDGIQTWKTTKMEDDKNERQPKWKTTKMENDQKWKTTKNESRPKWKNIKMEDNLTRATQCNLDSNQLKLTVLCSTTPVNLA